jgi:tetratricopeptide (TPR) repeat protein
MTRFQIYLIGLAVAGLATYTLLEPISEQQISEDRRENSNLERAVIYYREALKESPRDRAQLYFAMTQNNLGNALKMLGERESGTARLEEAAVAYREALKEWTRDVAPYWRDIAQENLTNCLALLEKRRKS